MKTAIDLTVGQLFTKRACLPKPKNRVGRLRNGSSTNVRLENNIHLCTTTYGPHSDEVAEALAERIMLCWNHCVGMSNKDLSGESP